MIEPEPLQPVDRTFVRHRGRHLSYFSGCDYFRLASHPSVLKAAARALKKFGLTVSASRLTTGNHDLYIALEKALADFFAAETALLLPSGYLTSHAVAQAFAGQFSHCLIDERAHPALQDSALLLDCPLLKFAHCDIRDFARILQRCGKGARPIVLTDGTFAHDGTIAPLEFYLHLLPADGMLLVDDAHGAGVVGRTGKGSLEATGVSQRQIVQCITLSKAFGAYGGAVIGSSSLRRRIVQRSQMFIGTTPIPLPMAAAALKAVQLLKSGKGFRRRLSANSEHVKSALRDAGYRLPDSPSPIVPIQLNSVARISALKRNLLAAGIYPPFLKYPGSPANGYFRFVISSEHTRKQLDNLIAVLVQS